MKRPKKNPPSKSALAFVVDGETEAWYLHMLKRNESSIRVNISPEIPSKKSLEEQYKLVCKLSGEEYTKVFWLVDLDTIIKEASEAPKGKQSPIKLFEEYRETLSKEFLNVVVVVNNPCLEFWFLLHFERTSKYFDTCSGAETQLKKYLKNYEKTKKFFTKENDDIYLKLKPSLKTALSNSSALGCFDAQNPKQAMCEMELIFQSEELRDYFK